MAVMGILIADLGYWHGSYQTAASEERYILMPGLPGIVAERGEYTDQRLAEFRSRVATLKELEPFRNLSIYITGSFGRREAGPHSDLDLKQA